MDTYRTAATDLQLQDGQFGTSILLCDIHWCSKTSSTKVLDTLSLWSLSWPLSRRCTSYSTSHQPIFCVARYETWHTHKWCKECHACQTSKIHRHTRAPLVERPLPNSRFCSLHVDLAGPLPTSHCMTYLFTFIDRFTRWPEAIPIPDAHASTCATALIHHWIARFGVPENITSRRGGQFTSTLWTECNKLLGNETHTTTAYQPQANDMVERFHCRLKAALKARTTGPDWVAELPMVLLGICSSWCVDPNCSPAELVYGSTLCLPGEFLQPLDAHCWSRLYISQTSSTHHALRTTSSTKVPWTTI